MDIFLRNVPYAASEMEVRVALAQVLHRPPFPLDSVINFHVELFHQKRSSNHKGSGILTLPTVSPGETFLRLYGCSGLMVKGRAIRFSQSNRPLKRGVVERLLLSVWEDPVVVQTEKRRKARASAPIILAGFSYGRFRRDGSFSAENDLSGTGEITCDINARQLKLTVYQLDVEAEQHIYEEDIFGLVFSNEAIYLPNQIKRLIASGISLSSPTNTLRHLFFESFTPPIFQDRPLSGSLFSLELSKNTSHRRSSLREDCDIPPGCNTLCLTFSSREDLEICRERCKELRLPVAQKQEVTVRMGSVYSEDNMAQVDGFLGSLEFSLAFQVEKVVMESILEPLEVMSLEDDILALQREYGTEACALFKYFADTLSESHRELASRRRRRIGRRKGSTMAEAQLTAHSLGQQLNEAVAAYSVHQSQMQPFSVTSPAFFLSYHLIVTPSTRILEGPLPDQSNSVLRRFEHHDCFIRVSFQDENRSKLRRDPEISISKLLKSRFRNLLIKGFRLAGRKYEFLGYSMSAIKEHSIWFVTPFQFNGTYMNASRIRESLGDFSHLMYEPARLAARWSQAFSATDPTITLEAGEIRRITDRVSNEGSNFTDGCGTISPELAQAVWSALRSQKRRISGFKHIPSCFQFRLGGAKGVVVLDPTLSGRAICLRPSQMKFEAPGVRTLDIQSNSSRPRPMFLNRPMIVILEHLGVKDASFILHQDRAINDIKASRDSFLEASKLFGQHGLGAAFRLPSLFSNLKTQLGLDTRSSSADDVLNHHLIEESIRCACVYALRDIKYRARIRVPGSYTLLGVSDEWGCLREGEIYATILDERAGVFQPVQGRVLITRSPQVHPGDVQYVTAVRRPELAHLNNVVVFSCEGERSLPSCLGGGDLDGDDYNLILDPTLHPPVTSPPGKYKGLPNTKTLSPCTINDVADFVVNYIESDLLGYISILHLRIADLWGPDSQDCMNLAELASHAVDYCKTGTPVNSTKLPRPPQNEKPDFLSREGSNGKLGDRFYRSEKILGTLFRRVLVDDYSSASYDGALAPSDGAKVGEYLYPIVSDHLGSTFLEHLPEALEEEMGHFLEAYCDQLLVIAQTHTLSKHPDSKLSEEELVSGTIMANWADHRKRREAVNAMNLQTQQLTEAVRAEFARGVNSESADNEGWDLDDSDDEEWDNRVQIETLKRAWAAWNVAEDALQDDPEVFGPSSFGLIALGVILKIIKNLDSDPE